MTRRVSAHPGHCIAAWVGAQTTRPQELDIVGASEVLGVVAMLDASGDGVECGH